MRYKKGVYMSKEELTEMIAAEEKRLGVGSNEFMKRHQEIIELADRISRNIKCPCQSTSPARGE